MSATSTSDDKINEGPHSVPTLNVQDVDANENTIANSSERSSAQGELKSGIITESDSKSRQRSGRSRQSSAKSKRAGTGKSKLTPVPTPAEDTAKDELCSDGEAVEDSDYDTDLEFEEPREEYDPTGRKAYRDACSQLGIIPVSFVIEHITREEINIKHHGLGPSGAQAIAFALMRNTTTTTLNLRDCAIGPDGSLFIARLLKENFYITELDLGQNKIKSPGAQAIAEVITDNNTIKTLNLSWSDFKDKDAACLAEGIRVNQTLTWLDLSHNEFAEEAGVLFGPAIDANGGLEYLNLSWNHLRGKGGIAIGKGLRANCSLKTLNLSWNGFADEGAAAVGESLKENNTLLDLDLSNNRISTEGAIALSKGLQVNNTLKILRIGMNPLQNAGAFGLLTAMKNNVDTALEQILLNSVVINLETQALVELLLGQHPGLTIACTVSKRSGKLGEELDELLGRNKKNDLIHILKQYVEEKNYRLIDLFNQFDKDNSLSVTRDEFRQGLKGIGVPMTDDQLTKLIDMLDEDGDGEIDYGEFTWINEAD
ncbi:hypothetical protein ACROYT_G008067 [Oculina patagonica]